MTRDTVFNFSAGPAMLPEPVLARAQRELLSFRGSGMSVMEMSHRSPQFLEIFAETQEKLRRLLHVPETHAVLFLQGGATMQFSMVPLNLMGEGGAADYAVTGRFSALAAQEAARYGTVHTAFDGADSGFARIPKQEELTLHAGAAYFYYCANNTIYGTAWPYVPETGGVPRVCDMSSELLSHPVDAADYGVIFAGAQKNLAPAGLTVVIMDRRLSGRENPLTPVLLSYARMIEKDSMYNTPPCWCIYMLGLMLDWVEAEGGPAAMERRKRERAAGLYEFLDNSRLFHACAAPGSRSDMNVLFRTDDPETDARFIAGAEAQGLLNLRGHRATGGMRASLYNAMPMEGAAALLRYLKQFEVENHA